MDHGSIFDAGCDSRLGNALELLAARMRRLDDLITRARVRVADGDDAAHAADTLQRASEALAETWSHIRSFHEQALNPRDELLATLAHEIRTPLNAVLGWTRMLRRGLIDAQQREKVLATIEHNALVQNGLIEDVLEAARIGRGQFELRWQRVELAAVVESVVFSFQPTAAARRVELVATLDDVECTVDGDAARLEQVVFNLVSNALKFTPSGGRVHVSLRHRGYDVELTVSDSGQGIAADALAEVFQPFRQASDAARARGGLGLGLAIVKQLVELHGGQVRCDSAGRGKGATFTVLLRPRPRDREVHDASVESGSLGCFRVLVVDDCDETRAIVKAILESAGAEVLEMASAVGAVDRVRSWRPDVLLSDLSMPMMDGFALVREVRAMPPEDGGRVPAVAMTSSPRIEDARRAIIEGFQLHVHKPFEPAMLVAAVASAVQFRMHAS